MKKLLLVDDSRAVRLLGKRIINPLGFEILEAENGKEALALVDQHTDIEAVLLDWNMPVMDGMEFLKALRARKEQKQPIVVMCTTENDMSRIVEAIQAGANEYVMKPFNEDIIRDKLHETGVI